MSEIKPRAYYVGALNAFTTSKDEAEKMGKQFPVEALYPAAAYEALQKENAELKATISNLTKAYERESNDCLKALEERDYWYEKTDSLADKISEVFDVPIGEHSNVNYPFVEAMKILTGEYVTKFDKESAAQAKRIEELEAATQHLGLTPQQAADGLARHKAQVAEIEAQAKRIAELEKDLVEWNEFKKIRDAQMQALRKQMS